MNKNRLTRKLPTNNRNIYVKMKRHEGTYYSGYKNPELKYPD